MKMVTVTFDGGRVEVKNHDGTEIPYVRAINISSDIDNRFPVADITLAIVGVKMDAIGKYYLDDKEIEQITFKDGTKLF